MTVKADPPDLLLAHECRVLTRYLVGVEATDYVIARYIAAHAALSPLTPSTRFDGLLLRLARRSAPTRWAAAAFARVHAPQSALQNKLVALLAILETVPPSSTRIDLTPSSSALALVLLLGARALLAAGALVVGTAVLLPVRLAMGHRSGP